MPDVPLKANLRSGAISWRRLNAIVDNLKPGSAFHHAVTGSWWTTTDMILADTHDLLSIPASGKQLKETPTYPRPWAEKAKKERTAARLQAWKRQAQR